MERRGIPTLTITHDTFEVVARAHAETMGVPDVPLFVEPVPDFGIVGADNAKLVSEQAPTILSALTSKKPSP